MGRGDAKRFLLTQSQELIGKRLARETRV